MNRESKPVLFGNGGAFIDPMDCGSAIFYRIYDSDEYEGSMAYGSITLTDCSRSIQWEISPDNPEKLEKAIQLLREVQEILKFAKKHNTKKAANNKKKKDSK